jgi:hypothetical protein
MKFYLETASGLSVNKLEGFQLTPATYQQSCNVNDPNAEVNSVVAFTTEINSVEDILRLVDLTGGEVVVEWVAKYPPAAPRQHIPVLRIVDAPL